MKGTTAANRVARAGRYGMTAEMFEGRYNKQGGRCKICWEPGELWGRGDCLHADHCKETEWFRGFLCSSCNNGLMQIVDKDPGLLLKASVYKDTSRVEVSRVWDNGGLFYKTKEYKNAYSLFEKFKINVPEHDALYRKQAGRCAICEVEKPQRGRDCLHVDHCHKDGHIRGLLCTDCNVKVMRFVDGCKCKIFKAFEYKAKELHAPEKRKRQTKLTRLALAKKERQTINLLKSKLIELLLDASDWNLMEEGIRMALVEIDGHDPSKKVHNYISRLMKRRG